MGRTDNAGSHDEAKHTTAQHPASGNANAAVDKILGDHDAAVATTAKATEPGAGTSATDKAAGMAANATAAAGHAMNTMAEAARYQTGTLNAVDMLINQHREAATLLDKALATEDPKSRLQLVEKVTDALLMHMRIEEEIFYPAARKECPGEKKFVEHAKDEHKEAKELIAKLLRMDPADSQFKPTLKELTDDIKHHVEEEESDLLPTAKKAMSADTLKELGEQMHERFGELGKQEKPREMAFADTQKGHRSRSDDVFVEVQPAP